MAALEVKEPPLFVHTARYCLLLSAMVVANARTLLVAPLILVQLVPLVLTCHCTVGEGLPVAAELKLALFPAHLVCEEGCVVTVGDAKLPLVANTTSTQ